MVNNILLNIRIEVRDGVTAVHAELNVHIPIYSNI